MVTDIGFSFAGKNFPKVKFLSVLLLKKTKGMFYNIRGKKNSTLPRATMNIAKHKIFTELFCTNKEKNVISSGSFYDTLKFFLQNMNSIREGIKFKFYIY